MAAATQDLELFVRDALSRGQTREAIEAALDSAGWPPEQARSALNAYATVQVWAQAVEAAGSLDLDAVIKAMHSHQFDTVLGQIGFDEKGDVTGFQPWQWFVWQADGTYAPLE